MTKEQLEATRHDLTQKFVRAMKTIPENILQAYAEGKTISFRTNSGFSQISTYQVLSGREDIKTMAKKSIEELSEDFLKYYDEGFTIGIHMQKSLGLNVVRLEKPNLG